MRRLADRRLLKIVFRRPATDFPDLMPDIDRVSGIASSVEQEVSALLGVPAEEVIFKLHRSPPTRKSEGAVLIAGRNGRPQPLESRSAIFTSVDRTLREEHFECYAPLDGHDEQTRRRLISDVDDAVTKRITQMSQQPNLFGESHGT